MAKGILRREFLSKLGYGCVVVSAGGIITQLSAVSATEDASNNLPKGVYAVAEADADLVFLSGAAALDLYHRHPHMALDEILPDDPRAQTHMTMRNIFEVLRSQGMTWSNIVKVVRYQRDMNHSSVIEEVMSRYFGDWRPATVAYEIEQLSASSSLVELEMIAIRPRTA